MPRKAIISLLLLLFATPLLRAQPDRPSSRSAASREWEERHALGDRSEREWDSLNGSGGRLSISNLTSIAQTQQIRRSDADTCRINKIVYGWHPYWGGTAYSGYDYRLLSDVCYFGYDIDPATGSYTSIHNWKTTSLVETAHAAGTRVHLCAILFSNHATFFNSANAQKRLIDSLISLVALRGADGVNIDFEAVPASQRTKMTAFMVELGRRFHTERPGSQVSIALPAVDWSSVFEVAAMAPYVDLFIIMGYDFHWSNADEAGPVAPRNSGSLWTPYDVTRSTASYLSRGVPRRKLVLALPYYGYDWATPDTSLKAAALGSGSSVTYANARPKAESYGRRWEAQSSTPWYAYRADSTWHQCWYDDDVSLGMKEDVAVMRGLAGVGIWALGYDGARRELWDALAARFTPCGALPCAGTLSDMGGPGGNYVGNDTLHYTIAPRGAKEVRLSFRSFSIADDRLELFDGRDTNAPRLGSYTGQTTPGTVVARSGALTLRFRSNADTVSWGWIADWTCSTAPSAVRERAPISPSAPSPVPSEAPHSPFSLSVHPNPAAGLLVISFKLASADAIELEMIDASGRLAATALRERRNAGLHTVEIRPKALGLAPGTYVARLRTSEDVESVAVVVQ